MSVPIRTFFFLIMIFVFSFIMMDFNSNLRMKEDAYESVRAANQDALLDLQENYNNYEELNTAAMVERWLANFVNNEDLTWKEIQINFVQIETDPPAYLMQVKGTKKTGYAIVKKDAYINFHSGSTIITDDEETTP